MATQKYVTLDLSVNYSNGKGAIYRAGKNVQVLHEDAVAFGLVKPSKKGESGDQKGTSSPGGPDGIHATSAAAKKAAKHEIDLKDVTGTGQDGQILVSDVDAAIAERKAAEDGQSGEGGPEGTTPEPADGAQEDDSTETEDGAGQDPAE